MTICNSSIALCDLHFYAYHGVLPQERSVGAWYTLHFRAQVSMDQRALQQDDLAGTVSYAEIYDVIAEQMKMPSALLEHVAQRILSACFARFSQLGEAEICLQKDTPPIVGLDRGSCSVCISARP